MRKTHRPAAAEQVTTPRFVLAFIAILAAAAFARVTVALVTDYHLVGDAPEFDRLATSIANGDGLGESVMPNTAGPHAVRAPLYPTALGAVYAVVGDGSWTAARLQNAVFGTGIVAILGLLALRLWSRREALVVAGLAAVHPMMIMVGSPIALEPLLVLLSMATILAVVMHLQVGGRWWLVVAGVLLGLSILTRETAFALIPSIVVMLIVQRRRRGTATLRQLALAPAVVLVVAALIVLPWTIRNAIALDAFVPVSTSTGPGLAGTYNPTSQSLPGWQGRWIVPWGDPGMREIGFGQSHRSEAELDARLRDASLEFIAENPTYPFTTATFNLLRLFDLDGGGMARNVARHRGFPPGLVTSSVIASWILLGTALLSARRQRAKALPVGFLLVPLAMVGFMIFTVPANIRYRLSIEPYIVLLAGAGVTAVLDRTARRRGTT